MLETDDPNDKKFFFIGYKVSRSLVSTVDKWKGPFVWLEMNNAVVFFSEEEANNYEVTPGIQAKYVFHLLGGAIKDGTRLVATN